MADDEDQDDEDSLLAPIMDDTTRGMQRRLARLERWRIAVDIVTKQNTRRLEAIDDRIIAGFREQAADAKQRFDDLHKKLEIVATDQRTWQIVRNVFKWIAIGLGTIITATWTVSTFIYDHYHGASK